MGARDWFPEDGWDAVPPGGLRKSRTRVNKDIAHLTYARLRRHGKDVFWPHRDIVEAIGTDLFKFTTEVDQGRVASGFKGAMWQSLPWPAYDEWITRFDPTVNQPVATSGFGVPEPVARNRSKRGAESARSPGKRSGVADHNIGSRGLRQRLP